MGTMGLTTWAVILCLAVAAAPSAADDHAPRSLRMRASRPTRAIPLGRRVAQAPPDGEPGDPPADPAPTPPADPAPTPPADPAPTPPADPAPTPPADPAPAPAAAPPALPASLSNTEDSEDDGKTEVISVTETSIEHKLFTGRAPVSVVTRADLAASGRASLGDILQSLPAQSNAGNAQVNAGGDGTTRINLRGLGAPRTLVLINGRRIVNSGPGADAAVDVNAVPLPMIERVEILKDGASALYGADAVGGVVNLITRTQYDGVDVSLLTSASQRGDGFEYDASAVTGFTSHDKNTYLVVSGGYQRHYPVFGGDRTFSSALRSYDFTNRIERVDVSLAAPDGRIDASSIGAGGMHPPGCSSNVCKRDGDGWSDFVAPRDLYNDAAHNYLYTPSSRYNVFGTAGNRINNYMALFIEALYLRRYSDRELSPVAFAADSVISKDSLYNPLGGDILDFRRRITELGPRHYHDDVSMTRFVLGVTGTLPPELGFLKDWKYEVSHNWASTDAQIKNTGQLNKPRVADALGPSMIARSMTNGRIAPICVREPGNPATQVIYEVHYERAPTIQVPCIPLNVLAPSGTIPSGQLAQLTFTDSGQGTDTMRTMLTTLGGRIAELPDHGEITLSLGGDYRYEVGRNSPGSVASTGDTTDTETNHTDGRFHVFEGFGELAIVPISGHDIAQWVELDLGARGVRHGRFGSSLTYKAGGLFRTVHGIAARGTYATAFRAPSLPDIFSEAVERITTAEDPCDAGPPSIGDATRTLDPRIQAQCTAQRVPVGTRFATGQQFTLTGGNPDLQPETAATTTIGVVVEPPRLKGLAVSADYWHIDIDNAIETLGAQTILGNCYDRGVQSYCKQVEREFFTHRIVRIKQFLQNVTHTTTSGIDLALWYDTKLVELGRVRAGLEAQYLLRYDLDTSVQVIHGVGYYDLGVYPRYKANLSGSWVHPRGVSGSFTLRYVGSYKECAANNCNNAHNLATASRDVDRYLKLDLSGGYDFHPGLGKTTLQVGINNLFDATPPVVYNSAAANSDAATYDFMGRMAYVRLSQLF